MPPSCLPGPSHVPAPDTIGAPLPSPTSIPKYLLLLFVGGLLLLDALVLVQVLEVQLDDPELPAGFGNHQECRDRLREVPGEPYTFGVIGDIQDSEDGENLLELLWQKDLAFLVLLGDVVRSGKAGYHRRLAHEIHELGPPAFPVFYVPGNRDVKTGEDPLDFTLEDFRARYGASSFHVSLHGSLFVFAEIPDPSWNMARSLDWVEEVLQTEGPRHDRIFLFSHVPVSFSDVVDGRYLFDPAGKRLKGILERYPVDYHVAAHHHGYLRTRKGDTVYLVTGGGGGTIRDENWQGAHHAMLFELGPDSVTERLVVIPHEPGLGDTFEGLVVGELLPQVRRRPRLLGWVALVHLILLAAVVAVVRRRSPGSPAAPA